MVPSHSPGASWEVDYLHSNGLIEKTLFIMPPATPHYDVAAMWHAAQAGPGRILALPDYDPEGAVLTFASDGGIRERWPFAVVWDNTLGQKVRLLVAEQAKKSS